MQWKRGWPLVGFVIYTGRRLLVGHCITMIYMLAIFYVGFPEGGKTMTTGEIGLTYLIATIVAFVAASMMMKKGS